MKILAVNGGSSSFKASLFEFAEGAAPRPLWDARVDWKRHEGRADLHVEAGGTAADRSIQAPSHAAALAPLLEMAGGQQIDAVGHRIVHGGRAFRDTTRITAEVKAAIASLASLAPEHNRLEIEAIEAAESALGPAVPQVAVFDTAFHATLAPEAYTYPGPYGWVEDGIRRFGFHGISHQYVSRRAAQVLGKDPASLRMIVCHLGSGCSLAAIRGGRSVNTTMGFTPLEGLMMGTRSGSVDPGILLHLLRHSGWGVEDLDHVLNEESGLKGVSGISNDMRDVLAAIGQGNERARLAFQVFVHRLTEEIGAMLPSLGGLDALVFTAGVGENCAPLRAEAAAAFAFLGMKVDRQKNEERSQEDRDISPPESAVRVLVVHTREELEIANEVYRVARIR